MTDEITTRWIRNKSDELAAADGCRFDVERGAFTVWWIERYLKLYEGEHAGEPVLQRAGSDLLDIPILEDWDDGGRELSIERAAKYADWYESNKFVDADWVPDWQYETTMRMFGWVVFSTDWNREIRRFNQASIWIPKKQKKSPTLAAWGCYLTLGDSEPGAKSFGGAKDGQQARIAMDHAIAMIEQSPELSKACKVNKNEHSIYHAGSRSKYEPMSSADKRTQEAKEGRNGNILIDETHVVDRDFMSRLKRAGISRPEPFQIEVSTVGNNPDSYGKERQDYARNVLHGVEENKKIFVAIYEAPQDLSDKDLDENPIKYGKIANPAWGHTAHEEEFLADYLESKQSIRTLNDFKMYRLNIWQNTAAQWLRGDQWMAGTADFSIFDFDLPASVGLDLSLTRDMSAITASIDKDGLTWQESWIWATRAYVDQWGSKAAFAEWERDGHLIVVEKKTIDYDLIREKFVEIQDRIGAGVLVYDKTYAEDFKQWVEKTYTLRVKVEGHKRTICVEFPQSYRDMEGPIDVYEAKVRENKIRHAANACLDWQAGHCCVRENNHAQRLLSKPKRDDYRKIDGMVTSVMSDFGVQHIPKKRRAFMPVAV